jgi:hypothetical protein
MKRGMKMAAVKKRVSIASPRQRGERGMVWRVGIHGRRLSGTTT